MKVKGKAVKCYHCEQPFPEKLASYFPHGSSGDPFRPVCPNCAALVEGESSER